MNLLAIDTSTEAQVLGLIAGEKRFTRLDRVGRGHSQTILPSILSLLDEAGINKSDLDGIVFGQGPGSFTGLRISVGVVQGLGYGLGIPVVPVSTLACLAQGALRERGAPHVVVVLIARNREVYFGSYSVQGGIMMLQGEEGLYEVGSVPPQDFTVCDGVGSGWVFRDELELALKAKAIHVVMDVLPKAEDLLLLGEHHFNAGRVVSAMFARPQYLREKVAAAPGERED